MKHLTDLRPRTDDELQQLAEVTPVQRLIIQHEIERTDRQLAALLNAREITTEEAAS